MQVVIAESQYEGHYFTYVRRVLEAMRDLPCNVTLLVSPKGMQSEEFSVNIKPFLTKERVIDSLCPPRAGLVRGSLDLVSMVRNAVKTTSADHIIFPTADVVAQAVGVMSLGRISPFPKGVESEGLLTNLSFAYPNAKRKVPRSIITLGLGASPWSRLHTIDILAYQWLKNRMPRLAKRFTFIPDPVERFDALNRIEARRLLGIPEEGRYLVCPGILIYRKGIGFLLDAFKLAKLRRNDRILLAGPVGRDVALTLKSDCYKQLARDERIVVIDRYLNVAELGYVLCAGDLTVCPYPQQWHPSSIAIKSIACERPVLGANSFWLGTMIPAFKMGWTVPVHDSRVFASTIEDALDQSHAWCLSSNARALVELQSIERFKSNWVRGIRSRLGLDTENQEKPLDELILSAGLQSFGINDKMI